MVGWKFLMLTFLFMSAAGAGRCPAGFDYRYKGSFFGSRASCYRFVKTDLTWMQARENCRKMGADLVTIDSIMENTHLFLIIKRHSSLQYPESINHRYWGYWTGGNDLKKEGEWRWVSNDKRLSYNNWAHGMPDNYYGGTEHCLQLIKAWDWVWNDAQCNLEIQGSICEIGANY